MSTSLPAFSTTFVVIVTTLLMAAEAQQLCSYTTQRFSVGPGTILATGTNAGATDIAVLRGSSNSKSLIRFTVSSGNTSATPTAFESFLPTSMPPFSSLALDVTRNSALGYSDGMFTQVFASSTETSAFVGHPGSYGNVKGPRPEDYRFGSAIANVIGHKSVGIWTVIDRANHCVRAFAGANEFSTVGTCGVNGSADGPVASATFSQPFAAAETFTQDNSSKELFLLDDSGLRMIDFVSNNVSTLIAGLPASTEMLTWLVVDKMPFVFAGSGCHGYWADTRSGGPWREFVNSMSCGLFLGYASRRGLLEVFTREGGDMTNRVFPVRVYDWCDATTTPAPMTAAPTTAAPTSGGSTSAPPSTNATVPPTTQSPTNATASTTTAPPLTSTVNATTNDVTTVAPTTTTVEPNTTPVTPNASEAPPSSEAPVTSTPAPSPSATNSPSDGAEKSSGVSIGVVVGVAVAVVAVIGVAAVAALLVFTRRARKSEAGASGSHGGRHGNGLDHDGKRAAAYAVRIGSDVNGQAVEMRAFPKAAAREGDDFDNLDDDVGISRRVGAGTVDTIAERGLLDTTRSVASVADSSSANAVARPREPSIDIQVSSTGTRSTVMDGEVSTRLTPLSASTVKGDEQTAAIRDLCRRGEWTRLKLLGRGAFGSVYSCVLNSGTVVAMKEMLLPDADGENDNFIADLQREIDLVSVIEHPNVIKYYCSTLDKPHHKLLLFMELAAGGTLAHVGRNAEGRLPESVARYYLRQVLRGLAYIHSKGVIHRDLKSENFLLTQDGTVKIGDFGTSRTLAQTNGRTKMANTVIGTVLFMAPELLGAPCDGGAEEGGYDKKADVWSFGIAAAEILDRGRIPWPDFANQAVALLHISNEHSEPIIPEQLSDGCKAFLRACLVRNPRHRPSAAELLQHPWLNSED